MVVNIIELRRRISEKGFTIEHFSEIIGMDASTFYRKIKSNGESFTVGEIRKMVEVLELTNNEAPKIFCFKTRIYARNG